MTLDELGPHIVLNVATNAVIMRPFYDKDTASQYAARLNSYINPRLPDGPYIVLSEVEENESTRSI